MNTPKHTVHSFDDELDALAENLSTMASTLRLGYGRAIKALLTHNIVMAEELIEANATIDQMQLEAEKLCTSMLALRQPVAMDLRNIIASIKITGHLERIGDDIKNICRRVKRMKSIPAPELQDHIRLLAESGQQGLNDLEVLINNRLIKDAQSLYEFDNVIDDNYMRMYEGIIEAMKKSKKTVPEAMHVLFAAKNIERIGDNCTDIARLVYYQNTGEKL